jgi:hypothetical protein
MQREKQLLVPDYLSQVYEELPKKATAHKVEVDTFDAKSRSRLF